MSKHLPDAGFFKPSPDSTGECPVYNKEFYMFVQLTATTIAFSLYGAAAYPLTYMFRLIGYTCLSFNAPSIKLPCSGKWRTPICGWQYPITLRTRPSDWGGLSAFVPPASQSRSHIPYPR